MDRELTGPVPVENVIGWLLRLQIRLPSGRNIIMIVDVDFGQHTRALERAGHKWIEEQ